MLHEKGWKAARDRAKLMALYGQMTWRLKVPRKLRITSAEFARMTNGQVDQACRDLYNGVSAKRAKKLAVQLGVAPKAPGLFARLKKDNLIKEAPRG